MIRPWDTLDAVERHPDTLSGAWVFRGTRVPVAALFENLRDGATIDQFLEWLLIRLHLRSGRLGAVFGVQVGGLLWGAVVLGLLSISTASGWLLLGWWMGQTLELGLAGYVAGSGLGAQHLRPLSAKVLTFVAVMVALTIVMQSLGVAPASRAP